MEGHWQGDLSIVELTIMDCWRSRNESEEPKRLTATAGLNSYVCAVNVWSNNLNNLPLRLSPKVGLNQIDGLKVFLKFA